MSDSEENKSGASSALLNIASAYSDSDSSQEDNCEDTPPQKSLGSLVENLRAEAKRAQNELVNRSEVTSGDGDKGTSVTKIVRLDSGKVVKISTSKSSDVKYDENNVSLNDSQSLAVSNINLNSTASALRSPNHCDSTGAAVSSPCEANSEALPNEVCGVSNSLATTKELEVCEVISNNKETNSPGVVANNKTDDEAHSSPTSEEHLPSGEIAQDPVINSEDHTTTMGLRSSKGEVKSDRKNDIESVDFQRKSHHSEAIDGVQSEEKRSETLENDNLLKSTEDSGSDHSESQLPDTLCVASSNTHDKDAETESDRGIQETEENTVQDAKDTAEPKEKTESPVLIDVPDMEDVCDGKMQIEEDTGDGKSKGETDDMAKDSDTEQGNENKLTTAGSVAGLDTRSVRGTKGDSLKGEENVHSQSNVEALEKVETNSPKTNEVIMKSAVEGTEMKPQTADTIETLSPSETLTSNKVIEAPLLEVKKSTAPIKLKRNFSCISTTLTTAPQPEKKFQPEPSQAARSGPSNSEMLSRQGDLDTPAPHSGTVTESHGGNHPQEHQEEAMMSPPRVRPISPTRLPTAFQQPEQEQTFANAINSSQNQAPSFQTPKLRSPSPPRIQTRITRREDKRRLPIILRKSGTPNTRSKDTPKSDNLPPPRSASVEEDLKPKSEPDVICLDTVSSDSQGQSASVPFSTSSSNLESSSTFGGSVDFGNAVESSTDVMNKSSVTVDSGSDNAQPAPTTGAVTKEPTSFLTESAQETPTIIIPKKRGRPRKFPLPEPVAVEGAWSNDQAKTPKSSKRKKTATKKYRPDGDGTDEDETPKRRYIPRYLKKKSDGDDTPETPRIFNKKGRMEVMTEGCKPVTVNQITEYFWPPVSTLGPGEKAEGLMIQEQISEYLGVKSFKRKYPSIKRRPVDMEERNYLQENGFVSENMCDMGLTAVYSSDIIEIMYNDFPSKFEEYRRYTREKKLKEQKALREKQAAENMDPRKEALESIVSWNTEFNKSRSGVMERSKPCYNYRVLLGEWYERRFHEEFNLAMYLKKKERDALLLSKVRRLFSNLLRDVQLSLPTRGLAYGGLIQLMAPDVAGHSPLDNRSFNHGLVLSVTLEIEDIDFRQDFDEHLLLIGSPVLQACARNSFYIDPEDKSKEGQALCYGDVFYLRCAADTVPPLYVSVPVLAPFRPVGKSGFPIPRLSIYKDFDTRFRVLNLKPELSTEIEGLPVLPFERVLIVHAPSGIPLCTETGFWEMSLFSPECEISTHAMMTLKKEYGPENQWVFVVATLK